MNLDGLKQDIDQTINPSYVCDPLYVRHNDCYTFVKQFNGVFNGPFNVKTPSFNVIATINNKKRGKFEIRKPVSSALLKLIRRYANTDVDKRFNIPRYVAILGKDTGDGGAYTAVGVQRSHFIVFDATYICDLKNDSRLSLNKWQVSKIKTITKSEGLPVPLFVDTRDIESVLGD